MEAEMAPTGPMHIKSLTAKESTMTPIVQEKRHRDLRSRTPRGGSMKTIVQESYGPPERVLRLEDVDRPSVGDDDILVRVRATSVNTPDWITVTGVPYVLRLQSGVWQPRTPVRGTDVAGVV